MGLMTGDAMSEFEQTVHALLEKCASPPLNERWQDAVSFGAGAEAVAFFVHDAPDVVNVVWLNEDGIRDITWLRPESDAEEQRDATESMFNFIALRNITSIELHTGHDIAQSMGPSVQGDLLVQVFVPSAPRGQLYWIAHTEEEAASLRKFVTIVLGAYISQMH